MTQGPPDTQAGGSGSLLDRAGEETRQRVRALPGNLTYLDLIRKNKRDSVVLIVAMITLGVVVGGLIAAALAAGASGSDMLVSVAVGCGVALVAGSLGTLWSWNGGASAILRMSGAHEITRERDLELFNVVDEVRIAAGLPMPRVYLIDDSALNAFATGRDPAHAAVAITSGLRSRLTRDELQGVLAHELSHVRHLDTRFALLMATMAGLIAFACDAFLRTLRYGRMGRGRGKSGGAVMLVVVILAVVLAILAPIVARLVQMAYSRRREYLADAGAVELTRNPEGLASALQKLADDREPLVDSANRGTAHLFIVNPLRKMRASGQSLDSVFHSHPPIRERIARLLALTR